MFSMRKSKPALLGLAFLLTLLAVSLVTVPAFALNVHTGKVTRIKGDTITVDGYKKFVPANEHARVPDWVTAGTNVKVGYYTQKRNNYYYEIGRPGMLLQKERELEGRRRGDY